MKIEGVYRDELYSDDVVVVDSGWRSNTIVADFGRFLAALMKRDFVEKVGIEYMAVGGGNKNEAIFKANVKSFFETPDKPFEAVGGGWAWAKKIDESDMVYLDDSDTEYPDSDQDVTKAVTNRLGIRVVFGGGVPVEEKTLVFEQFALLGIDEPDGKPDTDKIFFVDYVKHGPITKDASSELTRTVFLTFPLGEGEVQ